MSRRETLSPPIQIRCPSCGQMVGTFRRDDKVHLYTHFDVTGPRWCPQRYMAEATSNAGGTP